MSRPAFLVGVQVALVVAILGCVLTFAARHPRRFDLTPERRFTLSPHTREVLGRVVDDLRITLFYSSQEGALRREMADLLALYEDASPRVRVRLLDLDRSPGAAERLGVDAYNVAVVESGERRERVDPVVEETVTAAVLAVAGTPPAVSYFVLGHGERDPRDADERSGASEAARALAAESFVVRVLEGAARIPQDAGLVVLAGPVRDLAPAEAAALVAYVGGGGHMLVLCGQDTPASVRALLARFGVELARDVVVDEQGRLFGADGLSARIAYLNQALVPTTPEANALLPLAQSVRLLDVPGLHGDYLAMTAETTWADVERRSLNGPAAFQPGTDRRGPLPVAALVRTDAAGGAEGRVAVVGDAEFVTNLHLNVLGNRDLLLAAAELAARADPLAAARSPARPGGTFSALALTAREARLVFWGAVVAPSLAFATLALLQARRRRFG